MLGDIVIYKLDEEGKRRNGQDRAAIVTFEHDDGSCDISVLARWDDIGYPLDQRLAKYQSVKEGSAPGCWRSRKDYQMERARAAKGKTDSEAA